MIKIITSWLPKLLNPQVIIFIVSSLFFIWLYNNYTIISNEEFDERSKLIETYKLTIDDRDGKIKTLKVKNKKLQSTLDACKFEKEVEDYLKNMGDDYVKIDINASSDYLPF